MRIEAPHRHERLGAVRIHDTVQVIELDTGPGTGTGPPDGGTDLITPDQLAAVESTMSIVVPVRNERRKVIEGVLSGIPHSCPIVLVSASERDPVDRFAMECETLERFCGLTGRRATAVHQDDPGLGAALSASGMGAMVVDGITRRGKGEAMIVGMLIADAAGTASVGFIDADNYVPGAVHEYVKAFAAGLHLAPTPYSMVRISWNSKPKIEGGRLVFNRWGRSSHVTNRYLNLILSTYNGFGTEVITTGNAGEHALTLGLARRMRFAGGFAVEPFEVVELFEQFGGALPTTHPEVTGSRVDVYQVETRNPHFHEDKGESHVDDLRLQSLRVIAGSPICPAPVVDEIRDDAGAEALDVPPPPIYPPLGTCDVERFDAEIRRSTTFVEMG